MYGAFIARNVRKLNLPCVLVAHNPVTRGIRWSSPQLARGDPTGAIGSLGTYLIDPMRSLWARSSHRVIQIILQRTEAGLSRKYCALCVRLPEKASALSLYEICMKITARQ